jgi:hypothetical protein
VGMHYPLGGHALPAWCPLNARLMGTYYPCDEHLCYCTISIKSMPIHDCDVPKSCTHWLHCVWWKIELEVIMYIWEYILGMIAHSVPVKKVLRLSEPDRALSNGENSYRGRLRDSHFIEADRQTVQILSHVWESLNLAKRIIIYDSCFI